MAGCKNCGGISKNPPRKNKLERKKKRPPFISKDLQEVMNKIKKEGFKRAR